MKWMGLAPFSNIQVSSAAATASTRSPTATRTLNCVRPTILASTEKRPAPVNSRAEAPTAIRNGALNGSDQAYAPGGFGRGHY